MPPAVLAVCTHKTCRRHGSERVCRSLEQELERAGVGGQLAVQRNGCIGACGSGCSLLLEASGVTLAGLRPADTRELVRRGLAGKKPQRRLRAGLLGEKSGRKRARRLARDLLGFAP